MSGSGAGAKRPPVHPAATATEDAEVVASDGRTVGRRGAVTRRRLLDATATLLVEVPLRDLRVVDIAREVGTSPATFYQYFRDVEDAVLVLADDCGDAMRPLAGRLDEAWDGLDAAREFVAAFIEFWDQHSAVLRVRNLAAQEGDSRFRELRRAANLPFIDGLAEHVRRAQAAGRVDAALSPITAAAALMALLERMATFHRELTALGSNRAEVIDTCARIVRQTIDGHP
jgi:AcrR family transcriptional regulator